MVESQGSSLLRSQRNPTSKHRARDLRGVSHRPCSYILPRAPVFSSSGADKMYWGMGSASMAEWRLVDHHSAETYSLSEL